MKKLAIVLAALLLASVFVGCGAANLLVGTKWDVKFGANNYGRFDFQKDNVCKYYWAAVEDSVKNEEVTPLDYTWAADGNLIQIYDTNGDLYGEYEVEIKGNEMTWTQTLPTDKIGTVLNLTRVKD
jgi:hypothetical protein